MDHDRELNIGSWTLDRGAFGGTGLEEVRSMGRGLPQGKLPAELLARLLASLPPADAVLGPRPGEDAAVLPAPDGYLVVTSDPITFTAERIGRYAVQVNANDVAAMGAEPRWLLATVLLPPGTHEDSVAALVADLGDACAETGVSLVGGHTEVTDAVNRVVAIGTMLGVVAPDRLVTSSGARPGDALLLTKSIAIEGTAVLAREAAADLLRRGVAESALRQGAALLDQPGIGVLTDSRLLCQGMLPHALHDVTEGGLATALRELADASGVGVRVQRDAVPVLPVCATFCATLELDPLGVLGSGSLLAAVAPEDAEAKLAALRAAGLAPACIGAVTDTPEFTLIEPDGSSRPLPSFARDELARYLEERPRTA